MQINLYGIYRINAGEKTFTLDLPDGIKIDEVLHEILRRHPVLRKFWLTAEGDTYSHLNIFVNKVDILALPQQMDTPLKITDTLDFLPPVGGGSHESSDKLVRIQAVNVIDNTGNDMRSKTDQKYDDLFPSHFSFRSNQPDDK
jgi:molybdopterin converting factor small subunit